MSDWNQPPRKPPAVVPFGRPPQILTPTRTPVKLVPPEAGEIETGLNIRSVFNNFLEPFSQMVLVQRLNLQIHCQCWNEVEGEGETDCPLCLGRGYLAVYERHRSRRMSSDNEHKQQVLMQSTVGAELQDMVFWYFEYQVNPEAEDIVYEVTWADAAMTLPQRVLTAYRVNYADPFRASGGRIEYWRCACEARPILRDQFGDELRRLVSHIDTATSDGVIRYAASYRS